MARDYKIISAVVVIAILTAVVLLASTGLYWPIYIAILYPQEALIACCVVSLLVIIGGLLWLVKKILRR